MTALISPITGFVPTSAFGPRVTGPSRSMLNAEQKQLSVDDPLSFRYSVGRGAGANETEATEWMQRCNAASALHAVDSAVIIHSLERGHFCATGIIADVSLDAYEQGEIKRHERTIAKTEAKMVDYMASTRLFGNPVALAHRHNASVTSTIGQHTSAAPDVQFGGIDGTSHSLWIVNGEAAQSLCDQFTDSLYITDGHHRLAAAASLATAEGRSGESMPAGIFDEEQLELWAFSRGVRDASIERAKFIESLRREFVLEPSDNPLPRPPAPNSFGVRIDGMSFTLTIPAEQVPDEVYAGLDANLLQDLILEPMLGVADPSADTRLDFVADTSDDDHAPERYDAWFLPYPTSVGDVMAVADLGRTMPPKSTFFLPKLPSGLIVRPV